MFRIRNCSVVSREHSSSCHHRLEKSPEISSIPPSLFARETGSSQLRAAGVVWKGGDWVPVCVHVCICSSAPDPAGLGHVHFLSLRSTRRVHKNRQPFHLTLLWSKKGPWGVGKGLHCLAETQLSALLSPGPGPWSK